jgi:PAS domain S-box-containing protein
MVKKADPSNQGRDDIVDRHASGTMPAALVSGTMQAGHAIQAGLVSGTMPTSPLARDSVALDDALIAAEIGLEKRLRTIVANVPIVLFSTDRRGTITLSDGRGLEALGLRPGQLVGLSALEIYGRVALAAEGGGILEGEEVFRRALAGETVHGLANLGEKVFDLRVMPLLGGHDGGEIIGTIGIGTDVTERVRAERAMREQEERLAATLDSIGEAVIATDDGGAVRHMNPVAERLTGWSAEEAVGRSVHEVVRLVTAGSITSLHDRVHAEEGGLKGPTTIVDALLVNRRGGNHSVAATWAPIRGRGGVVLTLRDTTDERIAVEALQRSEASFRALIEGSPEMILVHRDGLVAYANRALSDNLGFAPGELLGRAAFDLVHPDDRDGILDRAQTGEGASGGEAQGSAPRTVRFKRKQGGFFAAENVALRLVFGGEPAVVVIGRDVTERDEIHQQLLRSDRMASLGTLSAGVAHEINNPLTYVLVNLEHVLRRLRAHGASPDAEALQEELTPMTQALAQAIEGATRVRQIVRDLMTFSRGHVDQKGIVDVRRVLEASIQMATHELRHRAKLEKRLREVPPVEANEARLAQVFLNLLVNAAHAIPEGDAKNHTVTVASWVDAKGAVVVEISDTGAGIAPSVLSCIFDPFFTTRPTGSGSGLGLAISHGIVKSFGGDLTATSEEGKGSTFRITLPAAPGYDEATRRNPSLYPSTAVRRKVLVIDDDPRVGEAIALSLKDEHDITVLTNGRAGLDRIAEGGRFDVILCDLMMPEMTGMDFYREILRVAPQLVGRLVFMSGGAFTPRARAFVEGLPNRCIEKPPDAAKLRELVRRRGA